MDVEKAKKVATLLREFKTDSRVTLSQADKLGSKRKFSHSQYLSAEKKAEYKKLGNSVADVVGIEITHRWLHAEGSAAKYSKLLFALSELINSPLVK